jgi:hypothetical protein
MFTAAALAKSAANVSVSTAATKKEKVEIARLAIGFPRLQAAQTYDNGCRIGSARGYAQAGRHAAHARGEHVELCGDALGDHG